MPKLKYAHKFPTRKPSISAYIKGCRCPVCTEFGRISKQKYREKLRLAAMGDKTAQTRTVGTSTSRQVQGTHRATLTASEIRQVIESPPMDEDAYRESCWQNLRQLIQAADSTPGKTVAWTSEDNGNDVIQLTELVDDWRKADPRASKAYEYALSDDDLTFYLWTYGKPEPASNPKTKAETLTAQLDTESQRRQEFERQQLAAQRQAQLVEGSSYEPEDWAM